MSIFNSHTYTANVPYIISSYIREYDISKANISVLYKYGVLTKEQYEYYYNADRMTRQIDIGLLQRDKAVEKTLSNGIMKAKHEFFAANDIQEEDILSIKNDAIFIINKIPEVTVFDNIKFLNKNTYTSFYKLNNLQLYYFLDNINNVEQLDIKGMGDSVMHLHENYFLEFLKVVFASAQTDTIDDTLDIIITFYNQYLNRELNVEYYRTFDSESVFKINIESMFCSYNAYFIEQKDIDSLDISHNLNILRQLYSYFSNIKFYGV